MTQRSASTATVITVTGSERHVSMTHGSHNGRLDSFPHLCDAIGRHRKLGGEVTLAPRTYGHQKARRAQRRVNPFNYQDPLPETQRRASWWVAVCFKDWFTGMTVTEETAITADSAEDAAVYAEQITEKRDNVLFLNIVKVSRL